MIRNSGIRRYIEEQIPAISKSFDTTVILNEKDVDFAVQHNLKYIILNASIYSLKEQLAYLKVGDRSSIFWNPHYNVPFLFFQSKVRIATIHDVCHLALANLLSKEKRVYAKQMIQHAVSKSDKIITVSEFS